MPTLWFDLDEIDDEEDDYRVCRKDEDCEDLENDNGEDGEIVCPICGTVIDDGVQCEICGYLVEIYVPKNQKGKK